MKFIDEAEIEITAGTGGRGCMSFRREKYVSLGGPNGGDGGRGGNVIVTGEKELNTLMDARYKRFYKAKGGSPGGSSRKAGKSGEDIVIKVPLGTILRENGDLIVELLEQGQKHVVALGGKGGRGNARFATATNRAPRKWEPGIEGENRKIKLELKLLADIGLVGFPNAGKSTLISAVSSAKPKIADYPFTTLVPNLGIVQCHEFHSFVMADIPGLIEGAHEGKGLGDRFLRHIARTRGLLFLIEITEENPVSVYRSLRSELELHNPDTLKKPQLIVLTKNDLISDFDTPGSLDGIPVISISSVNHNGLDELKNRCCTILEQASS
ncbi:GTPase ObgE [candidate division KSB1 bacterium]|nr:GTPase ObgE [candidate division KSB1 bacterium]